LGGFLFVGGLVTLAILAIVISNSLKARGKFRVTGGSASAADHKSYAGSARVAASRATADEEPPNRYTPLPSADITTWMKAIRKELTKDGLTPDSICLCYAQNCGDGQETMNGDYWDVGIGAYKKEGLLRFVIGKNNHSDPDVHSFDVKYSDIKLLILRKRRTPRWQRPIPADDGTPLCYEYYYQTRVYTPTDKSYAPKGLESRTRLLDARYVFDWLSEHTGAARDEDTQEEPMDGFPEGV
jgi:hypothetical protein